MTNKWTDQQIKAIAEHIYIHALDKGVSVMYLTPQVREAIIDAMCLSFVLHREGQVDIDTIRNMMIKVKAFIAGFFDLAYRQTTS